MPAGSDKMTGIFPMGPHVAEECARCDRRRWRGTGEVTHWGFYDLDPVPVEQLRGKTALEVRVLIASLPREPA